MKKVTVLGSTGSIGTQALDVIEGQRDRFSIEAMTCGKNIDLFKSQLVKFQPKLAVTANASDAETLSKEFPGIEFLWGMEGLITAASQMGSDIVLNSLVGMMGILPTYHAIQSGADIALANKETLVAGGEVIMKAAKDKGVAMLPVDSEHSAIFQSLQGNKAEDVNKLLLTASGGPFRGKKLKELEDVTLEQALKHPNWSMGSKITIDSSTLMNKGLEVIEAAWLFSVPAEQIQVVVHPESIIHSMVEYKDHSIIAQLGLPDMRVPIAYAFSYPERLENQFASTDFFKLGRLTFEEADMKTFACLGYAYEALKAGGSYPVALNAANEVLVELFLQRKIKFLDIQRGIGTMLDRHSPVYGLELSGIIEVDEETRRRTRELADRGEI